jgi:DNA mismatch repair protein MutS2
VGAMKLSAALGDLELSTTPPPKMTAPKVRHESRAAVELSTPVRSQDVILDLRGKRVDASLDELDGFIDELLRRQEEGGYVLHGHGTGAMKEAVRNHLGGHACVRRARPAERDEGGDAFTVFWLSV